MSAQKSSSENRPIGSGKEDSKSEGADRIPHETKRGSLVVIGTGIRTVGQLTIEAIAWMEIADSLLYVVADPVAEAVMERACCWLPFWSERQRGVVVFIRVFIRVFIGDHFVLPI